jgi:hypothetical protein
MEKTFGNFAQTLKTYFCKNGMNIPDFVKELVENIIVKGTENPVEESSNDSLINWYNDNPTLPRNKAVDILYILDKERFKEYISELSDDGKTELILDLRKNGLVDRPRKDFLSSSCANIFTEILKNCASGPSKKSKA